MVVCLSRAHVLYQMLSLINVYKMINTRNSLIAYIRIYNFIVHLVCGYNMDGGGNCNSLTVCGIVFGVYIALLLIVTFDCCS